MLVEYTIEKVYKDTKSSKKVEAKIILTGSSDLVEPIRKQIDKILQQDFRQDNE